METYKYPSILLGGDTMKLFPEFEHEDFGHADGDGSGIYSSDDRTRMLEEDQISAWEAAFMDGWDESAHEV